MKRPHLVISSLVLMLLLAQTTLAQYNYDVLEFTKDPAGNGMGNIAGTTPSTSPLATISNPAQLGLFSLHNNFAATTLLEKSPMSKWSSFTLDARATQAGVNLQRFLNTPVGLSFGLGYSYGKLDMGQKRTPDVQHPEGIGDPVASYERYTNVSLAVGVEYIAKLGFGFNLKQLKSQFPSIDVPGTPHVMDGSAFDWGIMAQVPVIEFVNLARGTELELMHGVTPHFDIAASYTRANIGDETSEFIGNTPRPLPRMARAGMSLDMGFDYRTESTPWRLVSFLLSREAQADIALPDQFSAPYTYRSGAGELSFWDNVIQGKISNSVLIRKGWEISAGEIVSIRGGSVEGLRYLYGSTSGYTTSGYSVYLGGMLKAVKVFYPQVADNYIFDFALKHVDLQYHHSSTGGNFAYEGNDWSGMNVVLKGLW